MNMIVHINTIKCIVFVKKVLKYKSNECVIMNVVISMEKYILPDNLNIRNMGNEYNAFINIIRDTEKSTIIKYR